MNLILEASRFAKEKHNGQFRKYYDGVAYINHPMRVAAAVSFHPDSDEELVAAAWLHDVIEDCEVTYGELDDLFGTKVATYVDELSNKSKVDIPEANRAKRKAYDLAYIATISRKAKIVKLIDRYDNLGEIPLDNEEAVKFLRSVYLNESYALHQVVKDADEHLAFALLRRIDQIIKRIGV